MVARSDSNPFAAAVQALIKKLPLGKAQSHNVVPVPEEHLAALKVSS